MSTWTVHFLTIVGRAGEEAAAGIDALMAARRRLAAVDPADEFEPGEDPLYEGSVLDAPMIHAFCRALVDAAHRLPTFYASQFVFNYGGPYHVIDTLAPPGPWRNPLGPGPASLRGNGANVTYYRSNDTADTLAAIKTAVRRTARGRYTPECRMFLDHLRAAHEAIKWKPFTVVVIESCIGGTREDYEVHAAADTPLGVRRPAYFAVRPAGPADREALADAWQRAIRSAHHFWNEAEVAESVAHMRDVLLSDAAMTAALVPASDKPWIAEKSTRLAVLTADDTPVGFIATTGDRIDALCVDPAWHGLGGGNRLVRHALQHFDVRRIDLYEQNENARQFFERFGFKVTRREAADAHGRPHPVLRMRSY